MIIDYVPCKECDNPDVLYTCHKCGKCGREFQDGILLNGMDYPGCEGFKASGIDTKEQLKTVIEDILEIMKGGKTI